MAEKLRILRSAVLLEWDGLPINPTESAESQGFEEDDLVDGKVAPGAARIGSEIVGPAANALNVNPPTPGPAAKIIKVKVFLPTKTKPARYTVRSVRALVLSARLECLFGYYVGFRVTR